MVKRKKMAKHLKKENRNFLLNLAAMMAGCLVIILFTYQKVQSPVIGAGHSCERKYSPMPVPTLYIHGWHGNAKSTSQLIESAEDEKGARKVLEVAVSPQGKTTYSGKWNPGIKHPLIQVVFENNEAEIPDEAGWMKTITEELRKRYGISQINVVSHSMGGPVTLYWALNLRDKNSPQLQKFVPIAGPFDGVIFTDDVPNQNRIKENGEPVWQNAAYQSYYEKRNSFPRGVSVLNIYGNLEDGTNSDYLVTNASARSLRWLIKDRVGHYEEKMIRGPMAQHSKLHENKQVDRLVNDFLFD